jgi:hypothetical protein
LMTQDDTQGRGDVTWRKRAGGNLIEQRLKEMEIAAVDQRNVRVGVFEGLRRSEATEPASDDENTMLFGHVWLSASYQEGDIVPEG